MKKYIFDKCWIYFRYFETIAQKGFYIMLKDKYKSDSWI